MFTRIDTKQPTEVEVEVQRIYRSLFPEGDRSLVPRAFGWATDCFLGNFAGFQAIDARYHDLEHTLQGTLCLARLLLGRAQAGAQPPLTRKMFELALLAILLHDTGYLKTTEDTEGTGAKYTPIHVDRSAQFAALLLGEKGYTAAEIKAVQNMIHCTGINVDLAKIEFGSELEKLVGFALGSADLLGQMAADDYVDKLPILFQEFEESARFNEGISSNVGIFASADELMRKTPLFYKFYVQKKINDDFLGQYKYLNHPYPDGPNWYIQKIEANLERLRRKLEQAPPAS